MHNVSQASRLVVEAFFDRLGEEFPAEQLRAIEAEHVRLLEGELDDAPDEAGRSNRYMTAAVLAAYRVLDAASIEDLTRAFVDPLRSFVGEQTRAMLDAAPDPFAAMAAYARHRESEDFGAEFEFRHPADDDERFHADVHRCGYHAFFQRHGAPELTPVLCAFDANWIDALDPERDGFAFTRKTTFGLGGPICPFHFTRT